MDLSEGIGYQSYWWCPTLVHELLYIRDYAARIGIRYSYTVNQTFLGTVMNRDENVAVTYLKHLDLGDVEYEPDGNVPPDFLISDEIAVEVRRLNENYFDDEDSSGLEELTIPLLKSATQAFRSFDNQYDGESYFVGVEYDRPYEPSSKETENNIKTVLDNFLRGDDEAPVVLSANDSLKIVIYPRSPKQGEVFRLAVSIDWDSGGWVVPVYAENINYCVFEKSTKIKDRVGEYEEWWLLLIDYIGGGLMTHEYKKLRPKIKSLGHFDQVRVIDNRSGEERLKFT